MQGNIEAPSLFVIMFDYEERPINYRGGAVTVLCWQARQLLRNVEISKVGLLLNAKAIYFN